MTKESVKSETDWHPKQKLCVCNSPPPLFFAIFPPSSLSFSFSPPPEYIQVIMTLEESVQHVVMTAIQEVRLGLTRAIISD